MVEKDTTKPTFTGGPRPWKAGSTGATSVTVTLTASEVGTLYWVAYAASAAAPADATALINDATRDTAPSSVVARSATAGVDVSTDAVEIALTRAYKEYQLHFYAVLQDAAQNTSDLSTKIDITTATTVKYTCENGTARTGTPGGSSDIVACQSCSTGFTLKGTPGADNTTCVEDTPTARYTCDNGTPVDGHPQRHQQCEECKACTTGFALSAEKKCVQDSTAPTFTAGPALKAGTIGATSVTVTLTAR